ncbi:carbohydrate porin [Hydrogenovibrio marinus]|uniref:Uncharacterized protein n=1 Tax=Hydrogenovibrio marinus TaxID=28885 RepID=A0A066ZY33_HYDMR|nr:carbohydrate porin [Hydrogenovibrio marinus]KDN95251.1 hypothetical protein EI16_02800 [Hydrogenovibrio marinus]BBN59728.1 hypothetical protein HVMH_1322 [Hydrogenovibrio marinus]
MHAQAKKPSPLEFHAYATAIYQHSFDKSIEDDTSLSGDLYTRYLAKNFIVNSHIEVNSTPKTKGMASVIRQSNADAGTALSKNNQGRLQLSELYLSLSYEKNTSFHVGLLNSTVFFDTSLIGNNENTQFIASDFVNNPVIDFPDYALAGVVEYQFSATNTTRFMASSTNGLADNPNRDYSSLFEVNSDNKGIFCILETQWQTDNTLFETGVWLHNGDHRALDDANNKHLKNYGAYLTAAQSFGKQTVEARAGIANARVSATKDFVSLAYQITLSDWTLGTAYGYTEISKYSSMRHDAAQEVEVYGKHMVGKYFSLTPSVQYFKNPFHNSTVAPSLANEVWAANLRVNFAF